MLTAVQLSAYAALGAVALLAANLLLGLLLAAGYNPARHWPYRPIKLFRFHNWTGYTALGAVLLHPLILLFSSTPRFRVIDLIAPVWSPVQPTSNVLGAIALYLVVSSLMTAVYLGWFRRRHATLSEVEPAIPPKAAEIVDEPAPMPLARPALPAAFETSATAGSEDDHVAWSVRSTVRASV